MRGLLVPTPQGLHCPEGGFYVDPWQPVDRAVVTHAHSDHATAGCGSYLTSAEGEWPLRFRVGVDASVETVPYGEPRIVGNVRVSLHPAGHILGSAQVRLERIAPSEHGPAGEVLVFSGDYKDAPDPTCTPYEPVRCHTFITESTFALPVYRWPSEAEVVGEINAWWRENAAAGRTSVVFAYPLGKSQRVLAGLDPSIGPIGAHGAVRRMNESYTRAGRALPPVLPATGASVQELKGRGLVVAPPSTTNTPWLRRLSAGGGREGLSLAFVSGWMAVRGARRRRSVDRGFVLSDHADWPGLLRCVAATGAARVGATHGFASVLARWLGSTGLDTFALKTRYEGEGGEGEIAESFAAEEAAAPPAGTDGALPA